MSQLTDYLEWPAKAEPSSPFSIDDNNWQINDDLCSDDGYYQALILQIDRLIKKIIQNNSFCCDASSFGAFAKLLTMIMFLVDRWHNILLKNCFHV